MPGDAGDERAPAAAPLLAAESISPTTSAIAASGSSTSAQTLGNIVVSIIGTGVLGLPYAFRHAGWVAGSLGVAAAGATICYCMLLLVQCRDRLEEDEDEPVHIQSYGDLGAKAYGLVGRYVTEVLVLISQAGGAIAYLIFIGQNLSSLLSSSRNYHQKIPPALFIFLILLPLEIVLSVIRSLSTLAPFSAFADICNILAMAIVVKEDFEMFKHISNKRSAFNGVWGLPFAGGVAVFCFEGFSMTLPLQASMAERKKFGWVLCQAFLWITLTYILFGIFGYFAYGDETKDIITLNLPSNWISAAVKVGLCIALAFTFPIMMHPIHDIVESKLKSSGWFQKLCYNVQGMERFGLHGVRMLLVVAMAIVASLVPNFGSFISLVGGTVCAMLSFVLPAMFHLQVMGSSLKFWRKAVDYAILFIGVIFAGYGTYDAVSGQSISS